jgi:hypothetical protein
MPELTDDANPIGEPAYFGSVESGSAHSCIGPRRTPAARASASFARRGVPATSTSTSLPIPPSASRISWRCSRNFGRRSSSVMAFTDLRSARPFKKVEVDTQGWMPDS